MKYEILKDEVTWYISEEHLAFLFQGIDFRTNTPSIRVRGDWRGGLTFRPTLQRSASRSSTETGIFELETIFTSGAKCNIIKVPIRYMGVRPQAAKEMRQSAVVASITCPDKSILVTPSVVVETISNSIKLTRHASTAKQALFQSGFANLKAMPCPEAVEPELTTTESEAKTVEPTSTVTEVPELIVEKVVEPVIEPATITIPDQEKPLKLEEPVLQQPEPIVTNDQNLYDIDYAKLVIEEINKLLTIYSEVTPSIEEDGKKVKFTRMLRKRVQIAS